MTRFVIGDRVRRTEPPFSTGTIDLKEGQTIWVVLDNNGGRACYPFDRLERRIDDKIDGPGILYAPDGTTLQLSYSLSLWQHPNGSEILRGRITTACCVEMKGLNLQLHDGRMAEVMVLNSSGEVVGRFI